MGMLGFMFVDIIQNWKLIIKPIGTFVGLIFVILLTLAVGLLPYNSNWSNLGGLLAGAALGLMMAPKVHTYMRPTKVGLCKKPRRKRKYAGRLTQGWG